MKKKEKKEKKKMEEKEKKAQIFKTYAEGIAIIITALGGVIALVIESFK
jgi:hypothetical protein